MKRFLLSSCLVIGSIAQPVMAQVEQRSFWDLFSFDAFAQRAVQSMIMAARTQADITYEHMSTDPFTAEVALTGLSIWPVLPYDQNFACNITVDRLSLSSVPFDAITKMAGTADAIGLTVTPACLPPDSAQLTAALKAGGVEELAFDRVYMNLDYDVPSGAAAINIEASNQSLLSLDALLKFSYLSLEIRDPDEDPNPIMFLTGGRVEVEDRGAWAIGSKMMGEDIPPAVLATAMSQQMSQGMAGMNGADPALNAEQEAFILSAGQTLTAFMTKPGRVVVELNPLNGEVFLDAAKFENPKELFRLLRPEFSTRAKARNDILSSQLLALANDPATAGVSDEDRLRAGRALISGVGAPRLAAVGAEILRPLAAAGNGEAALLIARELASGNPKVAYQQALLAGASGEVAALGLMDEIEGKMALNDVISLQAAAEGEVAGLQGLTRLSQMRDNALARLNGKGVTRSYRLAHYWARLATAASDNGAAGILRSIDRRTAAMGKTGADEWAQISAQVDRAALNNWMAANMGDKIAAGEIN